MPFTKLNLHPKILQAIEHCGYKQPTPVQALAIPHILDHKDVMVTARTGTGKTAAFVLPGLQLLLTKKSTASPRILILSPTRELASQITKVIGQYSKFAPVNLATCIGGMPYHKQLRELKKRIDFMIATPGRLMDHMENKRFSLSNVEMLVIDEADRMLDMGFIDDIKIIVQAMPKNRQTLLLSATADDRLLSIMKNLLKDPIKINVSEEKIDTNLIKQKIFLAKDLNHKNQILEHLLTEENMFKAIIFSATKRQASKMADQLGDKGYGAAAMHGDLKQNARNRTLEKFRKGDIQFLIATDVAARGIDVTDISHVINYDLPRFAEDYVHRIGRTGRAGKKGVAFSIATKHEISQIRQIERFIKDKIPLVQLTHLGEQEWRPSEESSHGHKHAQKKGGHRKNSRPKSVNHGQKEWRPSSEGRAHNKHRPKHQGQRKNAKPNHASHGGQEWRPAGEAPTSNKHRPNYQGQHKDARPKHANQGGQEWRPPAEGSTGNKHQQKHRSHHNNPGSKPTKKFRQHYHK
jgi:superfamily II DNA/RNA helicase